MSLHAIVPSDASMRALVWALLLVLWQTSLLALAVRAVFHHTMHPKPQQRHAVAWGALWVAVAIAGVSLWVLRHPLATRQAAQPLAAPVATASKMLSALPAFSVQPAPAGEGQALGESGALRLLPRAGWLWLAAVMLLASRVLGGWLLARRVVRRAAPVTSRPLLEAFDSLCRKMAVREPVRLLESADVGAPVTMGWPRPTVLFPSDLIEELPLLEFEALAAHELGHVKRRDYVATLAQVMPDTLLFFSPGVRWLSSCVREAREQCCDDMAVAACGSAALYAAALCAVAERGFCLGVGVLGATAPRLADRIRRLSEGDPMLRLNRVRWWALAAASFVLATIAAGTGAVSLVDTASSHTTRQGPIEDPDSVPGGHVIQQPGAPLTISATTSTPSCFYRSVRVRNVAEVAITSVTLVAAIETVPPEPVVLIAGEPIGVTLKPGEAAELTANVLRPSQALAVRERLGARRVQSMLAVLHVTFADGTEWRVLPRAGARTFGDAFYMPSGSLAASHVGKRELRSGYPGPELCSDDAGFQYSAGAVIAVSDAPGSFAWCVHGRWAICSTSGYPLGC